MKLFVKFLVFLTVAAGCAEERIATTDPGEAFFPLRKGFFQVYSVNETRFAPPSAPVTLQYELRHEVTDSFPSAENEWTYVIHRSKRPSEGMPWEPLETWSARREGNNIVVSEGNTAYVKVRFPVRDGVRWNGNAYNALGDDEYLIQNVGKAREVGGMSFERTMTVEQENNPDLIVYQDRRSEIYAADAGMIYREVLQLSYCSDEECLGQQKIELGTDMKMEIKLYGIH